MTRSVFEGGAGCTKVGRSDKSRAMGEPFRFCDMELELLDLENGGVLGMSTIVVAVACMGTACFAWMILSMWCSLENSW